MEEYRYKVSDFEGPLDLLLYLIEKNKVDIYHIPVAEIADQLVLSNETIKTYVKRLLTKLDLRDRVQLVLLVHAADPAR